MNTGRLSEDEKAEIWRAVRAGELYRSIGRRLGWSGCAVRWLVCRKLSGAPAMGSTGTGSPRPITHRTQDIGTPLFRPWLARVTRNQLELCDAVGRVVAGALAATGRYSLGHTATCDEPLGHSVLIGVLVACCSFARCWGPRPLMRDSRR